MRLTKTRLVPPAVVAMRAARWVQLASAGALAACQPSDRASVASPRRFERITAERDVKLYDRYGDLYGGGMATKLALRAGGGVLAYLQRDPHASWLMFLRDPNHAAGGATLRYRHHPLSLKGAVDIVRATDSSDAWFLIGSAGRVATVNVGMEPRLVMAVPTRSAFAGCARADSTLYFLDTLSPGVVNTRRPDGSLERRDVPATFRAKGRKAWAQYRFGGSDRGACVLWAPRVDRVLVVDEALTEIGPLVERTPTYSWVVRFYHWVMRRPLHRGVLDVTSFAGGLAVLFDGHSAGAGRNVDFYSLNGVYRSSWRLPERPLGIAGGTGRLYVLATRSDSVMFRSYILPAALRRDDDALERDVIVARPPRGAVRNDSLRRQ